MRLLIAATCIAVLATVGNSRGGAIEDQLRQLEPMARDFCRLNAGSSAGEEKCVGLQLIAATTLVVLKAENARITDAVLRSCFMEVASKNAGQIDFVSALSCAQE